MHENVLAAVIWLDEPVAFFAIEPLHGALSHVDRLSDSAPHGRYSPQPAEP
jgi:hypothetical protein